jgi:hypothetical protein
MRSLKWLKPLALALWIHLHAILLALSMILTWVAFDHDLKRTLWIYSAGFGVTMSGARASCIAQEYGMSELPTQHHMSRQLRRHMLRAPIPQRRQVDIR